MVRVSLPARLEEANAGNIVIQAQDSVLISGIGTDGTPPQSALLLMEPWVMEAIFKLQPETLQIANSAQIASGNTFGLGSAGNIMIQARDRVLATE